MTKSIILCDGCGEECIKGRCGFDFPTTSFIDTAGDSDWHGIYFDLCPSCIYENCYYLFMVIATPENIKNYIEKLNIKYEEY